jgi:probable F420-dependent oxidoreductase
MTIKFSVGIPNCREGRLHPIGSVDPSWLRTVAVRAEQLGYYSLWLNEFLETDPSVSAKFDLPPNYYAPLVTIGHLTALTSRIRFTTSTIVLPHHHPVPLSRDLQTLDALSGGRMTLGIGLGGSTEEFRRLRGDLKAPNRGNMMDEFVASLRSLLGTDRRASFEGEYVRFENLESYPKPERQPFPIFMAGEADGVLRRLARYGDGWIDTFMYPEALTAKVNQIRRYRRELVGDDREFEVARQFYVSIADTREAAQANLTASLPGAKATQTPPRRSEPMEMNLIGTPSDVGARLREYSKAGVTEICAIFYSPDAATELRQMERFVDEVIPAVK